MDIFDPLRSLLDQAVGNGGAVRNCRAEALRRREAERAIERLCARLAAADEVAAHQQRSA